MKMMRFIINALMQSIVCPLLVRTATGTGGSPSPPARMETRARARVKPRFLGIAAKPICSDEAQRRLVSARHAVADAEDVDAHDIFASR